MRETGMHRMGRALAALKMAEMARLGALKSAAEAARMQARKLRQGSRALVAQDAPGDMGALGHWQRHTEARAKDADARAAELDNQSEPLKVALARTLGRETVVKRLIADADMKAARLRERKAEDAATITTRP